MGLDRKEVSESIREATINYDDFVFPFTSVTSRDIPVNGSGLTFNGMAQGSAIWTGSLAICITFYTEGVSCFQDTK